MAALVGLFRVLSHRLKLVEFLKITGTSSIVGLLVIFMSFQVLVCIGSIESRNSPECNKPFNCGLVRDLRYPFRQRGSPAYCGELGFEMYCEGGSPMIIISSRSYQVLVYNTTLKSLTLAPMSSSDSVLCPRRLVNTSLNLSPFQAAWNTQNISLYYGCPTDVNRYEGLSNHQFNCSMNGTDTIGYFVVTSYFSNLSVATKDALRSCRTNVLVPAFASILQVLEHNPGPANLNVTLANGFGVQWDQNDPISGSSNGFNSKFKLAIGFGVAGVVLVVAALMVTFQIKKESLSRGVLLKLQRGKRKQWERIEAYILQYGSELAPKRYSYANIKKITKSFKDELGQGGFGTVYKGTLPDGRLVAVKVLNEAKGSGDEFINEVASISRTSHVNIVAFVGFCYDLYIRALIYEFMPNGSLDKFICHRDSPDRPNQLEVKTLYDIAIGIARGLEYLHQGCNTRILHFDIKPHNILLDDNFCPKISDFGLAKLCERKESIISTISARGTIGYIAPEVICRSFGGISHKSDVYSYGMMLLEMVGEKENIHSQTSNQNFPIWIYDCLKGGADLNLEGMTAENEELIRKMIIVSLWCIQSNPSDRPSITQAFEMLQGSIGSLTIPPTPFLYSPPKSPEDTFTSSFFRPSNIPMEYSGYGLSSMSNKL
ncbi:putative receptor-like protein kinase [Hibiscus syriacus]|uniref:Receptor-like protein kinase n=1 Tax=Hibiscus syriacus TaxID=106335 RepID=A0A6A2YLH3_HIBSY|nr:LEAF RUST 10 DISEASE-RESISTANCE LOCUS RECEPTOR-LIKE PROTEIN KINASE-like 2.5 [Hibiscus syriacus]KAE8679764.1 putative receptor-like protein kinase [Hibiscus syriacus]